jgi:polar amino acid transport system permease protein
MPSLPAGLAAFVGDLQDQWPLILHGLWQTLRLAGVATLAGLLGGMVVLYLRLHPRGAVRRAASAYMSFFIGTPLIAMLFAAYYGLPSLGWRPSPFLVAAFGFTFNVAAYNASYLLSAYRGLDHRELEAAKAQGFAPFQIYCHITLPQVLRTSMPALSNQAINNLKDSSYAFLIGYVELFARMQEVASTDFQFFYAFLLTALMYLALVAACMALARLTIGEFSHGVRRHR